MGQNGKVYNILSDKGLQYNAQFTTWPNKPDATVISKAGITSGKDHLEYDLNSTPKLNNAPMESGKQYTLDNKGTATWNGTMLSFSNTEYKINLSTDPTNKDAIQSNVTIQPGANPSGDGVSPHGLLGQTADNVAGQHVGVNNSDILKQGGTVIDGTVAQYEVGQGDKTVADKLFDTSFKQFNRFNG